MVLNRFMVKESDTLQKIILRFIIRDHWIYSFFLFHIFVVIIRQSTNLRHMVFISTIVLGYLISKSK